VRVAEVGRKGLAVNEPIIIYRIQDREGRGPFKPGFSHKWVEDRPDHDNLLPWMVEMGNVHEQVKRGMAFGVGCRSLETLRRWFTPSEWKTLQWFGYECVQMSVTRILGESQTQVFFEREKPLRQMAFPVELYA